MENFNIGGPKKQIRPNKTQVRMLVEYMREHPDFAAAKFTTANGLAQMQRQWETLATLLNEHGPARNAQQWKVTWRDQKSRARKEGSAHNCAMRATGNGPVPELSDNSALVLDTIGKETAVGAGRPESGIGFKLPVSAEGPPNKYEAGPTGSQKLSTAPQASAAPEKAGPAEMTKRKRKTQPPAQFLGAQIEANLIQETQLQSVNKSLAGINATLQLIYQSLETSNRLRKLQLQAAGHVLDEASMDDAAAGHVLDEASMDEEEYEYEELELDSE